MKCRTAPGWTSKLNLSLVFVTLRFVVPCEAGRRSHVVTTVFQHDILPGVTSLLGSGSSYFLWVSTFFFKATKYLVLEFYLRLSIHYSLSSDRTSGFWKDCKDERQYDFRWKREVENALAMGGYTWKKDWKDGSAHTQSQKVIKNQSKINQNFH